jgi:thymidylate synthase ThyX
MELKPSNLSTFAKIIADSISPTGQRITTFQLRYQRFFHSEFLTHRVFSRNASSSRAIPISKMIEQVRNDCAMPIHWGKNQSGMQAKTELETELRKKAIEHWVTASQLAADIAEEMSAIGLHKQVANRILEPFQYIEVVLTATDFANWFELRHHEDAQPEIYELARLMKIAQDESTPRLLQPGEWHLPYITDEERLSMPTNLLLNVSAARCCRVSYLRHDGSAPDIRKDLELCEMLVGARPLHASPFEHQATPDELNPWYSAWLKGKWKSPHQHGNFDGWVQHRKIIESKFYS